MVQLDATLQSGPGALLPASGPQARTLAGADPRDGLPLVCTLGGPDAPPPMDFGFVDAGGDFGGGLAFTDRSCDWPPLLLVTDVGKDAVHVIDVVTQVHVGYVAGPGTIAGPRGVAATRDLVAVSSYHPGEADDEGERGDGFNHRVHLFQGAGTSWTPLRVLGDASGAPGRGHGQLWAPGGVRFSSDGAGVLVADLLSGRVCMFRVADGSFVRHVATHVP